MSQFSRTLPLVGPDGVRRIAEVRLTTRCHGQQVWAARLFVRGDTHPVANCDGYQLADRATVKQQHTAASQFQDTISLGIYRLSSLPWMPKGATP